MQNQTLESTIQGLECKCNESDVKLLSFQATVDVDREKIQQLTAVTKADAERISSIAADTRSWKAQELHLQQETNRLAEELETARADATASRQEAQRLRAEKSQLAADLTRLQAETSHRQSDLTELQNSFDLLRKEQEEQQAQISRLKQRAFTDQGNPDISRLSRGTFDRRSESYRLEESLSPVGYLGKPISFSSKIPKPCGAHNMLFKTPIRSVFRPIVPEKRFRSSVSPSEHSRTGSHRTSHQSIISAVRPRAMLDQHRESFGPESDLEEEPRQAEELQHPPAPSHDGSEHNRARAVQLLQHCDFETGSSGRISTDLLSPGVLEAVVQRLTPLATHDFLMSSQRPVRVEHGQCVFYRAKVPQGSNTKSYQKSTGGIQCSHCRKHWLPCIVKDPSDRFLLVSPSHQDRNGASPDQAGYWMEPGKPRWT